MIIGRVCRGCGDGERFNASWCSTRVADDALRGEEMGVDGGWECISLDIAWKRTGVRERDLLPVGG